MKLEHTPVAKKYVATFSYGPRVRIGKLYDNHEEFMYKIIKVAGWAKTTRQGGKEFCFIEINDGSTFKGLQVCVSLLNKNMLLKYLFKNRQL